MNTTDKTEDCRQSRKSEDKDYEGNSDSQQYTYDFEYCYYDVHWLCRNINP